MAKRRDTTLDLVENEFVGAELGDLRRSRRLPRVAATLARDPSASVPYVVESEAELEACYRFLNNDAVSPASIMKPHVHRTLERARGREVLVVHDTSSFEFGNTDERVGLGPLLHKNGVRGFFSHVSLALAFGEHADPLGIVHVHNYVRSHDRVSTAGRVKTLEHEDNEYRRWLLSALAVSGHFEPRERPIHVMDREADIFELLAKLMERGERFVIRSSDDRATPQRIEGTKGHVKLSAILAGLEGTFERTVSLSRRTDRGRTPSARRIHPAREGRLANLRFSATRVSLLRPATLPKSVPKELALHVVHVLEVDPPDGESPIEWKLLTTEMIATQKDVERVVDIYRARWRIEELFKALKSGCAFEARQFRSYLALQRLLAVMLPIAWRMLRMRALARTEPTRPASDVLSARQVEILRMTARRGPLPERATVHDVLFAVAGLGGHLRRNGPPGWQTLGRGLDRLLTYEVGWFAATGEKM